MSKSKTKGSKGAAPVPDVLSRVKNAAVTKPAQTAKAKSKEIAKQLASKEEKKNKLKKVKEPTPESTSESSDAESEKESHQSESSEDSDSEVEVEKPVKNGKVNGSTHVISKSDEDESSAESDESESSADKAPAAPQSDSDSSDEDDKEDGDDSDVGGFVGVKAAESSDEEEEEDDDDEDDEEDEDKDDDDSDDESDVEKAPAKNKGPVKAEELSKKLSPIAADISSDEDSEEDSGDIEDSATDNDDSEEDSSDGEEEAKPVQPAKTKRKAEDVAEPVAKKSKTAADESQGGNLFVGNLSWNVDEEWLTREFEEFGELSGVRIITDRNTGRSKGFGYVEFVNAGDAAKAHAAKKGALVDNRAMNIDFANKRSTDGQQDRAQSRAKSFGDSTSPPTDTLFVGNLSFDAGQETVSEAFSEWGTILGVRLPTDRETGEPKGFGYVTFSSVDEAKAALENMQGADIAGRACRLDFSQPRPQNGESGGRGGGGFGGRGGGRGGFGGRGGGRGGFGDRGGRGGRGRGGFGDRGGRGGRGGTTNRGGFGDFSGKKVTF